MKWFKGINKILLLFLVTMLVFSVNAVEENDSDDRDDAVSEIITSYSLNEVDVMPVSSDYFTGIEEAAGALRDGMKGRESIVQINYQFKSDAGEPDKIIKELINKIYAQAIEHTGVPTEGDYLRWCIAAMNAKANYVFNSDEYTVSIQYEVTYYTTAEQEQCVNTAVDALVSELGLKDDLSDYMKIANIYYYICSHVNYDYANLDNDENTVKLTSYAAIFDRKAVCQGYATLFYRLALEAGMDARVVVGTANTAKGTENHAWNIVALDGVYYCLDSTWDSEIEDTLYFLVSEADLVNHFSDPEYFNDAFYVEYPISATSYNHYYAEGVVDGDFEYTIYKGCAILTAYKGKDKELVVPSRLGGYHLYRVAGGAIQGNLQGESVVSVSFSEGITLFRFAHLLNCFELKRISYPATMKMYWHEGIEPNGLWSVGIPQYCEAVETVTVAADNPTVCVVDNVMYSLDLRYMFYYPAADSREKLIVQEGVEEIVPFACSCNSKLKEVVLPSSLIAIDYYVFENAVALEEIAIPDNCELIDEAAFYGTNIKKLYIPKNCYFNPFAAVGCPLEEIEVHKDNPYICSLDGVLFSKDMEYLLLYPQRRKEKSYVIPDGVKSIYGYCFGGADALETVIIPDSVQSIMYGAFYDCDGLIEIEIPNSVVSVAANVFGHCESLMIVTLPQFLTEIPDEMFGICRNLRKIDIPESVTSVGKDAFCFCENLTELVLPSNLAQIGEGAFSYCYKLTSINIPDSCVYIGKSAFQACESLTEIDIPDDVTMLDEYTFHGCYSLARVGIPQTITYLGDAVFANCIALTKVNLPTEITHIGVSAFGGCYNLCDIKIPSQVKTIGAYAFSECKKLERVKIPAGVTDIGEYAFRGCFELKEVIFEGDAPSIAETAFNGVITNAYYPMDNETWQLDNLKGYEGDIKWILTCQANKHEFSCVTISPTCETSGCTRFSCGICKYQYETDYIDAFGHQYEQTRIEPTCTEGSAIKFTCINCGRSYTNINFGDEKGHREEIDKAVEATCTTDGKTEGRHCAACGVVTVAQQTVAAKGHTEVIDKAVAATCTASGKTSGSHCKTCGAVIMAQVEIPVTGHNWKDATCTAAKTCKTCGATSGNALGHSWKDATCTAAKTCKTCGATSGNALGHSWKNATCSEPKTCTTCGATSGYALGYNWADGNCTTPKTCKTCGTTTGGVVHAFAHEYDYKCDICGVERTVDMTRPMVDMFRMYDPNSGEHFYTGSEEEKNNLIAAGWNYEGVGFTFPLTTGKPVHRLYDPVYGEHLYTMDENEMNALLAAGWNYEGIAFNSGFENEVPQYRLHNPNATRGAYHFTASIEERDFLISIGWEYQGIGWYSLGA